MPDFVNKIKIPGIEILSSSINPKPSEFKGIGFEFGFRLDIKISEARKGAAVFAKIDVRESKNDYILAVVYVAIGYDFANFEEIFKKSDKSGIWNIPPEISSYLNDVTISTLRGLLFNLFQGTYLSKAIMPLIAKETLVPQKVPSG